jgi:hypothetical protein
VKITKTRSAALAITLSVLMILLVSYYWPIQEPYHPFNTDWNGCSKIATSTNDTALLFSYNEVLPTNSVLAIVGPSRPFSESDSAFIRRYLEGNGTVLLADDFGTGNSLLKNLNVSVRFAGKPLADMYYYSRSPSFPLVSEFPDSRFADNVSIIILDHPSYLEINNSSQVTTIASSSPFSFIDVQGNERPAPNESIASYAVMAYVHVGNGSLILVSDSNMFINEMIGIYDNMKFWANVMRMGESLVFDVDHLANAPLSNARIILTNVINEFANFVRGNVYVQTLLVALVVIVYLPFELFRLIRRSK